MKKWTLWIALASLLLLPACGNDDKNNNNNAAPANSNNNNENNNQNNNNNNNNNNENNNNENNNNENNNNNNNCENGEGSNCENNNNNNNNCENGEGSNCENNNENDKLVCDNATLKAKCQTLNGATWAFACNEGVVDEANALNCSEGGFTCFVDDEANPTEAWCGCTANEQCAALYPDDAPYCDLSINSCAECLKKEDCGDNEICEAGECVPGSDIDPVCAGRENDGFCETIEGVLTAVMCDGGKINTTWTLPCTGKDIYCHTYSVDDEDSDVAYCDDNELAVDIPDAVCAGHEDSGFCQKINGVLTAVMCIDGKVYRNMSIQCAGENKYCHTYKDPDDGVTDVAYCSENETEEE